MTTPSPHSLFSRWLAVGFLMVWSATAQAAPFEDSMAQRTLACTGCHGAQGRAAPDGYYPRLAGKPAGYLYNQLLNFREGRRHYGLMTQLIAPLSDAYLMEIAQYFANLDVPYAAPSQTKPDALLMALMSPSLRRATTACMQSGAWARRLPAFHAPSWAFR